MRAYSETKQNKTKKMRACQKDAGINLENLPIAKMK